MFLILFELNYEDKSKFKKTIVQMALFTKTCPCNIQRILENFGELWMFIIFAQNIDRGYMLEPPRRSRSNEYPQSMFWIKNKIGLPLYTTVLLYKIRVYGIYYTDMLS